MPTHLRRSISSTLALALLWVSSIATGAERRLVIFDNDWVSAASLLPLLAQPDVRVLGITLVTGDGWRDQGGVEVLRFLEDIGVTDIPVLPGAVFPLVNTRPRMLAWEQSYGKIPWKGAWNGPDRGPAFHPLDPYRIDPPAEGMPRGHVAAEPAAAFMIRQVHAHPHEITIIAAGPLTNLALAIRLDPEFASLAKQLVFVSGSLRQLKNDGTVKSDFNFIFDPEAADIVLGADWPSMMSVADAADDVVLSAEQQQRIRGIGTPAALYWSTHPGTGLPLWDELGAALVADPTLVVKRTELMMSVDIGQGVNRGRAHVWLRPNAPGVGERPVTVVQEVDAARFMQLFFRALHSR